MGWVSCLLMWHSRILNKIISMKLGVLSMSTVYVHWPACRDFPAGWYKAHIVQLLSAAGKINLELLPISPGWILCGIWSGGRMASMCILSTNPSKIPVHMDHIGYWEAPAVGSLEMPGRARYAAFLL